ncbi:MAG: DEAD/DEAH box helicase [Phycisphaerales bacterium]|nr:DEAD/DEAH box helicase [Phycisphaerales bacterium]
MACVLKITPDGSLVVQIEAHAEAASATPVEQRIARAFEKGQAAGLLHLGGHELQCQLPSELNFFRDFAKDYLTALCHRPTATDAAALGPVTAPPLESLAFRCLRAPPMHGLEYLNAELLARYWNNLDQWVQAQCAACQGGAAAYLRELNPIWRMVGRVTFHLAENKRDESHPFAFLVTYATHVTERATLRQLPLSQALNEYAGSKQRERLLALLTPISEASKRSNLARELVDSGDIYHPLAWPADLAYRFLKDIPIFEECGVVVRVPNWWSRSNPPRPMVSVRIGSTAKNTLGLDDMLDFSVAVAVDGQTLTQAEIKALLASTDGLALLRGKWVEINREQLSKTLEVWQSAQEACGLEGVSFAQAMRMLTGAGIDDATAGVAAADVRAWSDIAAGDWLAARLQELRQLQSAPGTGSNGQTPTGLKASLRPYQQVGVHWLTFMGQLGLGACLADDMGLGKTIQVIGFLLRLKEAAGQVSSPALLIIPASLIANWKDELAKFAPSLRLRVIHPSENDPLCSPVDASFVARELAEIDIVITTYGMALRLDWLDKQPWRAVILDEAQAIKNAGSKQTRRVKQLNTKIRIVLTGTPVENRLSDLWSIFDFINPGLLGDPKAFGTFVKGLADAPGGYAPLRTLVQPYILRRLKTDKSVIADLPDKTEVRAFCALSKKQIVLYQQAVEELSRQLEYSQGIQRKGLVLAYLMRFKQLCNHPAQWLANGDYDPAHSGKFHRLRDLCEEIAARQEKVLVFTQFREMTAPLATFLASIFGQNGLVLHGSTPVAERRSLVQRFQTADGPPFFVLSLKAGGVGLNLTAASHVIHFDRWWNPAVENQATDRAFRIGQRNNVLVHKFVCSGTLEERIDAMLDEKAALSREVIEGGSEKMLTEMSDQELLKLVSLDINRAGEV